MRAGIMRKAAARLSRWKNALTLKRARPGIECAEVEAALRLEVLLLLGGDDAIDERADLLGRELVVVEQALEPSVDADDRRRARGHVEIGGVPLDHDLEKLVD